MANISIVLLSFVAVILMAIAFIARLLGYIRTEYVIIIALASIIMQAILITILIRRLVKILPAGNVAQRVPILTRGIVIPKSRFDDRYISANSEILSQSVKPIHPWKDSIFRVKMELVPDVEDRPLKFYVVRKCSVGACDQEIDIIKPSDSSKHIFEINIDPKELINFKFSRDTIVKSFSVDELYIP